MENLIAFLNAFLEYGIVFIICVAVMVAGALIGISIRKSKNAKEVIADAEGSQTEN